MPGIGAVARPLGRAWRRVETSSLTVGLLPRFASTLSNRTYKTHPKCGPGHQPGQLSAVNAIAVDGKGRVYVSDTKGVQVFDSDGRYLTVFDPGGVASGMVFNEKNELLIVARNKVMKFIVNQ